MRVVGWLAEHAVRLARSVLGAFYYSADCRWLARKRKRLTCKPVMSVMSLNLRAESGRGFILGGCVVE